MKTNYITPILLLLLLCLGPVQKGRAQDMPPYHQSSFYAGFNSDAFMGFEAGYSQASTVAGMPVFCYLSLNIPLLHSIKQKKLDSWELKIGASVEPLRRERFLLITGIQFFVLKHDQVLGTFVPAGFRVKLTPAWRTKNGYVGVQMKYDQVLVTHIKHSDYVRNAFRDIQDAGGNPVETGPKDGWYAFTGHHLYYGFEGLFRLSDQLDLYVDLGMVNYLSPYTGAFDAMMFGQIPFYTDIQLQYKFNRK